MMKRNTKSQKRYAAHARHIRRNERRRARKRAFEQSRLARLQARKASGHIPVHSGSIRKIELASQIRIEDLQSEIRILLKDFGHPEALITDESLVWDLIRDGRKLVAIRRKLKIPISPRDYIFVVAERLAANRK